MINIFSTIANKYRNRLVEPKNLAVITNAVNTAAKEGRWKDLENWFMDQVIKTKNTQIQEFVSNKVNKTT